MKRTMFVSMSALLVAAVVGCASDAPSGSNSQSGSGGSTQSSSNGGSGTPGTGGTTTGGNTSGGGLTPMSGGYYSSGSLKGYFWTAADLKGSTISPTDFSAGGKICANGTAAAVANMDYSGTWGAILGWNINQAMGTGTGSPSVDMATLNGSFTVSISGSSVPSSLRFKVAVGTTDYCVTIASGSNTIKTSDLKASCWMAGGAGYAGEQVSSVAVQVPTGSTAVPYSFCIDSLQYSGS